MFSTVVDLYRALRRPPVVGNAFAYRGAVDDTLRKILEELEGLPPQYGVLEHYEKIGEGIDLEFSLPASEHGRFHQSVESFVESTPSLSWGRIPTSFYIVDRDFFSGEANKPEKIQVLYELCEFIRLISKLAADSSSTGQSGMGKNQLVFILAADGKSPAKTLVMSPRVVPSMLDYSLRHLQLLRALLSDERKNQIHVEERRSIMRLAIAEVVSSQSQSGNYFELLVSGWPDVLERYRHNVLVFLHQFSFEKIRKDIATAQIDYSTKLSSVLGDVAGKILALPVSLAGLLLLRKSTAIDEFAIYAIGLVLVTITLTGVLYNQWLQVRRLSSAFQMVFANYDSKTPAKLLQPIVEARSSLARQERALNWTFLLFGFLSILPTLGAFYYAWVCLSFSPLGVLFHSSRLTAF